MRILHLSSTDPVYDMSHILAEKIISIAESHAPTLILLSAGSWVPVYEHISKLPEILDCSHITVGLVDERWVSSDHADRNEKQIRNSKLVQYLELRGALFIPMIQDIEKDMKADADLVSQLYTGMKNERVNLFITIGIGTDGHIAGILPTSDKSSFDRRYLTPAPVVYYETRPEETTNPHRQRLTITPDFIRSANEVIVYASGTGKKSVLDRLLRGNEQTYSFPAQLLTEMGEKATLFTDQLV
ncbi:MAG: 6-phosphogluconolactonase [bacterium]